MLFNFKSFIKKKFPLSSYLFKNRNQILNLGRWGAQSKKYKEILTDYANQDNCGYKNKLKNSNKSTEFYKNKKKSI
jgi:hypothetical protein